MGCGCSACNGKKWEAACQEDVRICSVPEMPKCGHTLRRDATANLLSTILSLRLFYFKLRTGFNFSATEVCFPDHQTRAFPSRPCSAGVSLQGEHGAFHSTSSHLTKTLSTSGIFLFTVKSVSATTNQRLACKQTDISGHSAPLPPPIFYLFFYMPLVV